MKKQLFLIVLGIVFVSIWSMGALAEEGITQKAGYLNVFARSGSYEVELDNVPLGQTPLINKRVQAGSHFLKTVLNGEAVQVEMISIAEGEVTTVLVPSQSAEKTEDKEEKEETVAVPKQFTVGYDISWPFYGLSLIYHPGQHGMGLNYYQSQNYDGYDLTAISLRYYYYLQPNMYFSAGLGQYSDTREIYTYTYSGGWYYDYEYSTIKYTETLLGVQFGAKVADYTKYEISYGLRSSSTGVTNGMVMLGMGIMFDF